MAASGSRIGLQPLLSRPPGPPRQPGSNVRSLLLRGDRGGMWRAHNRAGARQVIRDVALTGNLHAVEKAEGVAVLGAGAAFEDPQTIADRRCGAGLQEWGGGEGRDRRR